MHNWILGHQFQCFGISPLHGLSISQWQKKKIKRERILHFIAQRCREKKWWLSTGSAITKWMLVLISLNLLAAKWVDPGRTGTRLTNCGVIVKTQITSVPLNVLASSLVAHVLLPSDSSRWPRLVLLNKAEGNKDASVRGGFGLW